MNKKISEKKRAYELKDDGTVLYQGIASPINLVSERNAIEKFLNKYWDVKAESRKPLSEIIDYVLEEGVQQGIKYWEIRSTSGSLKKMDFSNNIKKMTKKVRDEWKVTAKPKNYEKYCEDHEDEEYPNYDEELEFEGTKLHCILSGCLKFQNQMLPGNAMYGQISQGQTTIDTMLCGILNQGQNIGIMAVVKKYKKG